MTAPHQKKRKEVISNTILLVIATLFVMLVSCQFKYGILVVGSNSMAGTLNKGDGVIFEKYTNQTIEKGQVIIFNYNEVQSLSTEARQKLTRIRPKSIGDANRIPGVSPNDISVLLVLLGR